MQRFFFNCVSRLGARAILLIKWQFLKIKGKIPWMSYSFFLCVFVLGQFLKEEMVSGEGVLSYLRRNLDSIEQRKIINFNLMIT